MAAKKITVHKFILQGRDIMITEFITNHVFMSSILFFGMFSLLLQGMMTLSLKGYVKASANMKTTRKKVLVNLKNQFETIYGMDYQVRNISAYVDKYLLKLRLIGFSFSAWEKVPFLTAGIVTLLAGGGVFYGYMKEETMRNQIEILFAYGMVLVCLFVFFHIFGMKSRKQQIQIQLVDYLENYLANRLIRTKEGGRELKLLDEDMEAAFMEGAARNKELKNVILDEEHTRIKEDEGSIISGSQTEQAVEVEEDMDMLKRLIREIDTSQNKDSKEMIAVSREENIREEKGLVLEEEDSEESEIELLEEFVQSFLA